MNSTIGTRVIKFQYIAPIFWTFASKCIVILIIGKNKQFLMLWNFWLTLYFIFMNMFSFTTFYLFWFRLSKFELDNLCLQNCSITRIYNFCIIYLTDCFLIRRTCIIRTTKIPTTVLIVCDQFKQISIMYMHESLAPVSRQFGKKQGSPMMHLCGIKHIENTYTQKYYEPNIEWQ